MSYPYGILKTAHVNSYPQQLKFCAILTFTFVFLSVWEAHLNLASVDIGLFTFLSAGIGQNKTTPPKVTTHILWTS